ncbi:Zn-dependent exopeptidase [Conidiobolus coronatus NRRL 28638]|uniref:Peptide hydrolase n=1 Tax=Conidiobolus coronatus (strain ATCC 28846 / CBS 209.66 / NRRL 28638) TaxID=796925 RepID=A0A137P0T7_CONC2|nr:Zn-dependent exopeptidase [Conidiobolus coronatus NRRL 28638]|eukprot:KXN68647.1 Zn-dependent exopeptidase [Conidiobolus coronatus NRRL 28638]
MKFIYCLLNLLATSFISAGDVSIGELRLVQTSENEAARWIGEKEFLKLILDGTHFIDKTDDLPESRSSAKIVDNFNVPTQIKYKAQTQSAQSKLDPTRAKSFLTKLSNFHTRYYSTQTGLQAAQYIRDHAKSILANYNGVSTVEEFKHSWLQPSIIARVAGTKYPNEIVVLGAHLDSINKYNPTTGRSPGADDDGTGSTLLFEVLQSLVSSGFKPQRTIEFQWYAAEEVGLKGSRAIAQNYKQNGKNVVGMLQSDMVGYKAAGVNTLRVITDFTDPTLTGFLKTLIGAYSKYAVKTDTCGYACSDHASYKENGYRSSMLFETVLARGYHTEKDVIEDVDFDYLNEFCKVATAFAVEMAEPSN